jgi:hypothetical protein
LTVQPLLLLGQFCIWFQKKYTTVVCRNFDCQCAS